jgi:hypothetical protein
MGALGAPCPPRLQIYFWTHMNHHTTGSYATLTVADPGAAAATRRLQLSYTHYLPAGSDGSGACTALAAAAASAGSAELEHAQSAWTLASQVSAMRFCVEMCWGAFHSGDSSEGRQWAVSQAGSRPGSALGDNF